MRIKLRQIQLYLGYLRIVTSVQKDLHRLLSTILKPHDWLRQAWKSLVTKLSKPVVVVLKMLLFMDSLIG